jgi:hypothetical protein
METRGSDPGRGGREQPAAATPTAAAVLTALTPRRSFDAYNAGLADHGLESTNAVVDTRWCPIPSRYPVLSLGSGRLLLVS